jgi:RNA 2',3'-cyclic 3'-phosphodiesterase
MRLFIAIELDDQARVAIAMEQKRLKRILGEDTRSTLKWVNPEHMHLTLAFLGEVDDGRSEALIDAMRQPIARPPLTMAFGGIGVFPPHGAPRVLWLGVSAGGPGVIDIQRDVAERLRTLHFELEARPFHPHLTLARWRDSRPSDRRRLTGVDKPDAVARMGAAAVTLVHSRLSSNGPTYTALCEAPLQSP